MAHENGPLIKEIKIVPSIWIHITAGQKCFLLRDTIQVGTVQNNYW